MEAISKARFIRIAPRKTRLVVGLIRGRRVADARQQLLVSKKLAARAVLKALDSAIANAVNNNKTAADSLVVSRAFVDEGPKIKRFTPRAQGRATPIRLRMSHITIAVAPGTPKSAGKSSGKKNRA